MTKSAEPKGAKFADSLIDHFQDRQNGAGNGAAKAIEFYATADKSDKIIVADKIVPFADKDAIKTPVFDQKQLSDDVDSLISEFVDRATAKQKEVTKVAKQVTKVAEEVAEAQESLAANASAWKNIEVDTDFGPETIQDHADFDRVHEKFEPVVREEVTEEKKKSKSTKKKKHGNKHKGEDQPEKKEYETVAKKKKFHSHRQQPLVEEEESPSSAWEDDLISKPVNGVADVAKDQALIGVPPLVNTNGPVKGFPGAADAQPAFDVQSQDQNSEQKHSAKNSKKDKNHAKTKVRADSKNLHKDAPYQAAGSTMEEAAAKNPSSDGDISNAAPLRPAITDKDQNHVLTNDQAAHHVEEKFGKYFGYFSEMRGINLYIDPSKSKFWVKI